MKIICTICSSHKRENTELLPAGERYTGTRIESIKDIAHKLKISLYFLSGKYGLISESEMIPYYDYYLEDSAISALTKTVIEQIQNDKIDEIEFYSEDKIYEAPYKKVIEIAVRKTGVILHNLILPR